LERGVAEDGFRAVGFGVEFIGAPEETIEIIQAVVGSLKRLDEFGGSFKAKRETGDGTCFACFYFRWRCPCLQERFDFPGSFILQFKLWYLEKLQRMK